MTAARKLMSADEFLTWCLDQDGKWELVGGEPILMMTGASETHDLVVVNLLSWLRTALRGGPCRPTTDDVAARMIGGNVRRPDVTIACGPPDPTSLESKEPRAFFEVLSPSTRSFDLLKKPEEYKRLPSLRHIVLVDPARPRVWLWSRSDENAPWTDTDVEGLEATVALSALDLSLPMAEIYDGVPLEV